MHGQKNIKLYKAKARSLFVDGNLKRYDVNFREPG